MTKFRVTINARKVGAIGDHGTQRRVYEIECEPDQVNNAAIDRAYQDGDIEHVKVLAAIQHD